MEALFHAASADLYARTIWNACPLEIWVLAAIAGGVVLGSTNRVRVLPDDFRAFFAEWTDVCHRFVVSRAIVPYL